MEEQHSAIYNWLQERIGLPELMFRMLGGRVVVQGAWLRTTGVACFALVLVACITGIGLSTGYSAAPAGAYASILEIDRDSFGRLLRGVHHWASATLILLAIFTVIRMFFGGEYKRRHDVVWLAAVIFAQLVIGFQLTGHALPWDTNAVATAGVEAGIAGNVWGVGPMVKRFLLGGANPGAATLARWYGFHVALLPALLLALVGIPLLGYRMRQGMHGNERRRSTRHAEESNGEERGESEPYYPTHLAREMAVALIVFLIVVGLAFIRKTPLEMEATATNLAEYNALSEWYVLPIHALTQVPPFNGGLEPLATAILPTLLIVVLLLLPFIDRNPSRRLAKRPFAAAMGVLFLATVGGLYAWAYVKERPIALAAEERVAIAMGTAPLDRELIAKGKAEYETQGCGGCHAIGGKGGSAGPDLSHAAVGHPDRHWQIEHLKDPAKVVAGSTMPGYAQLTPEQLNALTEYMLSLR